MTGGSDHQIILWQKGKRYTNRALNTTHTSAILGLTSHSDGVQLLSCGSDRRVLGFDMNAQTQAFALLEVSAHPLPD